MKQNTLQELGWQDFFENQMENNEFSVGRIILEHKHMYRVVNEDGEWLAELSGKFIYNAIRKIDFPAVGDWVVIQTIPDEKKAIIQTVLERKSQFVRQAAGSKFEEQVVASNVDYIFIVNALNHDFNVRRIERYLLLAYESGANPVIVLTKKDLCEDINLKIEEVNSVAFGVPIYAVSNMTGDGVDEIKGLITTGVTVALLGSSGVGKSTLLNSLMDLEVQKTSDIREDDSKGRHTTTHRELFQLPTGGLVIDTPGMREIQLWDGSQSIGTTFSDIDELSETCRFSDCSHESEPGCSVRQALNDGTLSNDRFQSYLKLQREIDFQARKVDPALARNEKEKWKKMSKQIKSINKRK